MLNFPLPHPEELIYSSIARAGIRHGLTSPKQLLDEVFDGNRKVIATLDLPNHLNSVIRNLPAHFTMESLVYAHTLFPLYGPFIPEERRLRCLDWMAEKSRGSVHLAMGVAASIVRMPRHIRYCPDCLKEQAVRYGEYFWVRSWQAPGVECCPHHGMLLNSKFIRPQRQRHLFWPATPENCPLFPVKPASDRGQWMAEKTEELLRLGPRQSPSFEQWTQYYRRLAKSSGLTRGSSQIDHQEVAQRVRSFWPAAVLRNIGLPISDNQDDWLRDIFRKHRKSFGYLQHLVVHGSLLSSEWTFSEVVEHVGSISQEALKPASTPFRPRAIKDLSDDQRHWSALLKNLQVKEARRVNPSLYARLYRSHRAWLFKINQEHRRPVESNISNRVNWQARDTDYLRLLSELAVFSMANSNGPRRSRNYWLKQLPAPSTVEKKLQLLPMTNSFIKQYSETVPEFQTRRLRNAHAELKKVFDRPPRWRLLRNSGLSEERLTPLARVLLDSFSEGHDDPKSTQNQRHS